MSALSAARPVPQTMPAASGVVHRKRRPGQRADAGIASSGRCPNQDEHKAHHRNQRLRVLIAAVSEHNIYPMQYIFSPQ